MEGKECPGCKKFTRVEVKFCENCGYKFDIQPMIQPKFDVNPPIIQIKEKGKNHTGMYIGTTIAIILIMIGTFFLIDLDSDGLMGFEEIQEGTDFRYEDTDNDGLFDGDEVKKYKTNPTVDDSDKDGLLDGEEVNRYYTDPNDGDSDGDDLSDYEEVRRHSTNPNVKDSDNDGLWDYIEVKTYETNPLSNDTDGDTVKDKAEIEQYKTNPNDSDSDDDGLNDGVEIFTWNSDPNDDDTDNDNFLDGNDVNPNVDVIITVRYTYYKVYDEVDFWTYADVYFRTIVDGGNPVYSPIKYDDDEEVVSYQYSFNVDDDESEHTVNIAVYDDDGADGVDNDDEILDISGSTYANCVFRYDIPSDSWYGVYGEDPEMDGITSGNDDGSTNSDENDTRIYYSISDNENG